MSATFFAGTVIAPWRSTSAGVCTLTEMSRSVPLTRSPSSSVSTKMFESTGSVVRVGIVAATADNPLWKFSRVTVTFIVDHLSVEVSRIPRTQIILLSLIE